MNFLKKTWLARFPFMLKTCACHTTTPHSEAEEWPLMAGLAGACFIFGILGLASSFYYHNPALTLGFYILAYLTGGWDAAEDTWKHLKKGELDIHFLMLAVALGAALIGAWREGALLLFLFSASGAMEHFAMGRTKKAIDALFRGAPKTARILRDGKEEQLPIEALETGMTVLVTTGEQIPVDLEILKGESACDESNLTGEALPVKKMRGDTALSGTMNLWGVIEGRVLRPASESSLQKIIRLIQEAQNLKAPSQRFTDRFGTGYTMLILALCTVMFFVWWLIFKYPPFVSVHVTDSAFYRTMTLLVVASPCALVLSVPSAILSAIASGARRGILYRGGAAIETLAKVTVVALDKTGTITSGNLALSKFECLQGSEDQLKSVAYNLARLSEHPLSRAIRRIAATWDVSTRETEHFETLLGLGVKATIDGIPYVMGSHKLLKTVDHFQEEVLPGNPTCGGAVVWVAGGGKQFSKSALDMTKIDAVPGARTQSVGRPLGRLTEGKPLLGVSRAGASESTADPQCISDTRGDEHQSNAALSNLSLSQDAILGRMIFTDDIREEASLTLKQLQRDGIRTVMLTGDHQTAAEMTGKKVGVGEIMSELSPEEKVLAIEQLKQGGLVRVAMIGDGVNDAPCLAAADVGIAMGARGSDAALEQAEIVLMNDRIENFLLARVLSEKARHIIYQNITVALGTVLVMVTAAFLMPIPLTLGVAAHEGSTLLVVLNSLRLLAVKLPKRITRDR